VVAGMSGRRGLLLLLTVLWRVSRGLGRQRGHLHLARTARHWTIWTPGFGGWRLGSLVGHREIEKGVPNDHVNIDHIEGTRASQLTLPCGTH
jgi:hypothetical protein